MTQKQRIQNLVLGIGMLLCGVGMIALPELSYNLVALLILISLFLVGLRMLAYYQTMARHMVGGKAFLFLGILVLDFDVFLLTSVNTPRVFIVVYLLLFHSFSGVISLLRAKEVRSQTSNAWVFSLLSGIGNLTIAVAAVVCAVFIPSLTVLVLLYCVGFVSSALVRISSAFRNTAIVYIQ